MVSDMFDEGKYTKKTSLKYDLANSTEPFESGIFSDDSSQIGVIYFSGTEFGEIGETVSLK